MATTDGLSDSALRVRRAERSDADGTKLLEVELHNGSTACVGAGGLRLRAESVQGGAILLSATNHWPMEPGGRVLLSLVLPREWLKSVEFVDYIEAGGTVHALRSRLVIGWFFSELISDTVGADVQA